MPLLNKKELLKAAEKIKLLILDVDGILTNGTIVYSSNGEQIQSFHVHDGFGLKLLMKSGVHVALLSARGGKALEKRAKELGIKDLYQGKSDKLLIYSEIKERLGLEDNQIAFMGDDWVDLPLLSRVGLAATVPNCAEPVQEYVHYISEKEGGFGAVRELCNLILEAKGKLGHYLDQYLPSKTASKKI